MLDQIEGQIQDKWSEVKNNRAVIESLKVKISQLMKANYSIELQLYELEQKRLHIKEIFRLAQIHLPRLRKDPNNVLIDSDIAELKKWIGRVKSMDGYMNIIEALKRMANYQPKDVKNAYALIQKVIIEGPYKPKK